MNNKKLVFVFGRFQVPTKGHAELIHFVQDYARRTGAEARIYTSQSHDKDKNPLPYELKLMFLRQLFPGVNIVQSPHKILWQILKEISDQNYAEVTLVTGADRVQLFKQTFLPYCKPKTDPTFDKSKNYGFKLKVISSGARKKGVSGTDTRALIKKGDFESFMKVSATSNRDLGKRIFTAAKSYMKEETINEDLSRKDFDKMLKNFVDFSCDHLKIEKTPEFEYKNPDEHGEQPSFGGYAPGNKKIVVMSKNRHPMDIFRTVAHELVHHKQNEDGKLGHSSEEGSTGSDIENEANAMAGVIMRHYGKKFPDTFGSSYVTEENLNESIYNKGLFKVIFLAGGAGSGKDYILKKCLAGNGLRELNSDQAFEHILKKEGGSLSMPPEEHGKRLLLRGRAKNINMKQKQLHLGNRIGIIVNGTADSFNKIFHLKQEYESHGYETMMVFVGTSNKISRERNISRGKEGGREVPEHIRYEKWKGSHNNKERFKELFGADKFIFVDNSIDVRYAPPAVKSRLESLHTAIWKKVNAWVNKPVNNSKALSWIEQQKRQRGISEMDERFEDMLTLSEKRIGIKKKMKQPQITGDRLSDTLGKQTDYMNMGLPASDPIGVWSVKEETKKRFKERYGQLGEAKLRDTVSKLRKTYKESLTDPFTGSMATVSSTTGNDTLGTNGVDINAEREKLSLFGKKKKKAK